MPDITAVKTWATREDLTSTDLNAEFSNVYNNAVGKSVAQTISGRKTFTGGIVVDELLSIAASGAGHVKLADFRWDPASGTLADNDGFYIDWTGDDDVTPTETIYARDGVEFADVSDTTEDGVRFWSVMTAGTLARELNLSGAALYPNANDGLALGTTTLGFADFHLATGGVINWANGEITITETDANTLTIAGVATRFDFAAGILEMNNAIEWDTGVAVVAGEYSIGRDADGTNQLHENVPTGATFEWSVNDVATMTLSSTTLALPVSGSIISFNAGDVTITHSANTLAFAGAATGYKFDDDVAIGTGTFSALGLEVEKASANSGARFSRTTDVTAAWDMYVDANGDLQVLPTGSDDVNISVGGSNFIFIKNARDFVIGQAALATGANNGFLCIPSMAGAPTGAPTAYTGNPSAVVHDTTNNRIYFYDNVDNTWNYAALT